MNIIGKTVSHNAFGTGIVIEQKDTLTVVDFNGVSKQFQYPLAFEKFLTAADADIQKKLLGEVAEMQNRKAEQNQNSIVSHHQPAPISKLQQRIPQHRSKVTLQNNVAFKCTFCDGGKTPQRIGFAGICSEVMQRHNIVEKKRVWCSDSECACRSYLDGEIIRSQIGWPCYESRMLIDWRAEAGVFQSGEKRGQPIVMKEVHTNSLCILTSRKPNTPESERFIFGVFLADEAYEGDNREAGYVTADLEYRIELSVKESQDLMFWRYYANSSSPAKAMWGTGLFRYLNSVISAQILRDIARIKRGTPDEMIAERLLMKFCNINGVDLSKLSEPSGALTR